MPPHGGSRHNTTPPSPTPELLSIRPLQCTNCILNLPLEIIFRIFEYVIPFDFYCDDMKEEHSGADYFLKLVPTSRYGHVIFPEKLKIFEQFEELQNYLLIHRDLFYRNLMTCHCNRHFINIWKKALFIFDFTYCQVSTNPKIFTCTERVVELINQAKTGDYHSVQRLISAVFKRFNSSECFLETFFKVQFKTDRIEYPSYLRQCYEILQDILNSTAEMGNKKILYLKELIKRFPKSTQDPKYFRVIIVKMYTKIVSHSLYSSEIKNISKKSKDEKKLRNSRMKELLSILFSSCTSVPLEEYNIEYLSVILASTKVAGLDDLFDKLLYRWVLDNPTSSGSSNLKYLLYGRLSEDTPLKDTFTYCVMESFLVRHQFAELELLLSKVGKQSSLLIASGMSAIFTIYFNRFELFQQDIELSSQKIMNLIETCWNFRESSSETAFINILGTLVSLIAKKSLKTRDETPLINLLDFFYFGLFSKKILGTNLINMDSIILKSNILNQAIEHPVIFEHLMTKVGNRSAYKKQLINVCKDSSIFCVILDCSAHFMGNSDGVTHSYKLRTESTLYNTYDLFKKRIDLVKNYLQNNTLFSQLLMDTNSTFNKNIKSILLYCKTFDSTISLTKTIQKMQEYIETIIK